MLSGGLPFTFEEPIGNFNSSADAWDQVLWIAICASIGVMFGRFLFGVFRSQPSGNEGRGKAPSWYPNVVE